MTPLDNHLGFLIIIIKNHLNDSVDDPHHVLDFP